MSCCWLLINRRKTPSLFTSNLLVLIRKAFIIFTALLCILSHVVIFAFVTFVVADDQHHNNSCLQSLSKKTGPEVWTTWMYWHVSVCPMPSFRKSKVVVDTPPQVCGQLLKDNSVDVTAFWAAFQSDSLRGSISKQTTKGRGRWELKALKSNPCSNHRGTAFVSCFTSQPLPAREQTYMR